MTSIFSWTPFFFFLWTILILQIRMEKLQWCLIQFNYHFIILDLYKTFLSTCLWSFSCVDIQRSLHGSSNGWTSIKNEWMVIFRYFIIKWHSQSSRSISYVVDRMMVSEPLSLSLFLLFFFFFTFNDLSNEVVVLRSWIKWEKQWWMGFETKREKNLRDRRSRAALVGDCGLLSFPVHRRGPF